MMMLPLPLFLLVLAAAPPALATPAPAAPAPPAPAASGAVPALPDNVGEAQVVVVAGNVAGARDRALDEALRHVLEQALNRSVDEATRTAQARKIRGLLSRPRRYVRRYRTIEEGEVEGAYRVRVEAEVDEASLRRELEKTTTAGTTAVAGSGGSGVAVVGEGVPEGITAISQALASSGLKVVTPPAGQEARAAEWASRSGSLTAHVSASANDEGLVRGPGLVSVVCRLAVRLVGRQGGELTSDSVTRRAFAERPEAARGQCFARAASDLAGAVVRTASSELQGSSDLRTVVIDAQLSEPAALPILMKVLRAVGSVSSVELRRVQSGHAEIWVKSRQTSAALVSAIARDGGSALVTAPVETGGDVVRLRVSLPVAPDANVPAPQPTTAPSQTP